MDGFRWLGTKLPDGTFSDEKAPYSSEGSWWQCPQGHRWETRYNHINYAGSRCPTCANRGVIDHALIESLIRAGKGNKEIAKQAKCSKPLVEKVRAKLGIPDPRWLNNSLIEQLIREGKSNIEIKKQVGCSEGPVCKLRKKLGIPALNGRFYPRTSRRASGPGSRPTAR